MLTHVYQGTSILTFLFSHEETASPAIRANFYKVDSHLGLPKSSVFCKMSHAAVTFHSYSTHSVRTRFVCRFWEKPCIPVVSNIYLAPLVSLVSHELYGGSRYHRGL